MPGDADRTCQRNCWLIAACGGVLLAALLVLLARYQVGTALFFGLVLFAVGGAFLSRAFCTGGGQRAVDGPPQPQAAARPADPAPAPAPEPPKVAEPAPAAAMSAAAAEPAPAPAAPAPAPRKRAAPKPRARAPAEAKAKPAKREAAPTPEKAAPRASGLDAAMGRTKDAAATTPATILLAAPRGGRADDLKLIRGVGPVLEKLLNGIGVWHFDQIAAWKARDIALVDGRMEGFKGRITRDEWVKQARVLAKGGKVQEAGK